MFIIPIQPELSLLGLLQVDAQVLCVVRDGIASPIDSVCDLASAHCTHWIPEV